MRWLQIKIVVSSEYKHGLSVFIQFLFLCLIAPSQLASKCSKRVILKILRNLFAAHYLTSFNVCSFLYEVEGTTLPFVSPTRGSRSLLVQCRVVELPFLTNRSICTRFPELHNPLQVLRSTVLLTLLVNLKFLLLLHVLDISSSIH